MKFLFSFALVFFVTTLLSQAAAVDVDAFLRKQFTEQEYVDAGLEKLSSEEKEVLAKALARLLEKKLPAEEKMPRGDDRFGLEMVTERVAEIFQEEEIEEIRSVVPGKFTGWSGKTVFRLANGQVWQQSARGSFYIVKTDPEVTIRRAALGGYLLQVEGYNSSVRVRRVR